MKKVERLKEAAKRSMEMRNIVKVEGKLFTFGLQKNGGRRPVILLVEAEEVPERFQHVVREPNLVALREALEAGDPQAAQIARLEEQGTSVRIS